MYTRSPVTPEHRKPFMAVGHQRFVCFSASVSLRWHWCNLGAWHFAALRKQAEETCPPQTTLISCYHKQTKCYSTAGSSYIWHNINPRLNSDMRCAAVGSNGLCAHLAYLKQTYFYHFSSLKTGRSSTVKSHIFFHRCDSNPAKEKR